jgi:hypothetical protein
VWVWGRGEVRDGRRKKSRTEVKGKKSGNERRAAFEERRAVSMALQIK